MEFLVGLIPTAILGYLLWRADRRMDLALKEWQLERTALLQRIQAPEIAVVQDFQPANLEQSYVPFDDDEAYWKSKGIDNGAG